MSKAPSTKQLGYLERLGYKGVEPMTSKQASLAIDIMLESKDPNAAEKAILKQQKEEKKQKKLAHKVGLRAIKEEIRFMVEENRAYGGEGLFAGFRFIEIENERPNAEDGPYVGAFIPLKVAQKYPELLLRDTVDYQEVHSDDKLPRGTLVVIAPGQFKHLSSRVGCIGSLMIAGFAVIMLAL